MTAEAKIEFLIILLFPSAQNTKNFYFEENAHLMEALEYQADFLDNIPI